LLGLAFLISAMTAGRRAAIFARRAASNPRDVAACSASARNTPSGRARRAPSISLALTARILSRMSTRASTTQTCPREARSITLHR
jgi:hypothetical protein